jgi:phosphoribosyl 1,2-cyclic phosphodiesterase
MTESEFQLQQMAYSIGQARGCAPDTEPPETAEEMTYTHTEDSFMETMPTHGPSDCTVSIIASGSSGNATFIRWGNTRILIDAGISYRRIEQGLRQVQCAVADLDAVFLTHEHSDHTAGLPVLLKRSHMPIYTTRDTWQAIGKKINDYSDRFVRLPRRVSLKDVQVIPFAISHDAARPVGYALRCGDSKVTVATDLGYISRDVELAAAHADILILEANHDEQMLREGPYPYSLQARILGQKGHLSNKTAAAFLARLPRKQGMKVLLAHRSAKNNSPACTVQTVRNILHDAGMVMGQDIIIRLACQSGQVRFQDKE